MDQYTSASYATSKLITDAYSTSFGFSIRLFDAPLRAHIYALYGLVRVADEIVDTYTGPDQQTLLNNLEQEVARALVSGYSTNPLVHAFAQTARQFSITEQLTRPFFESMRMDLQPQVFDQKLYETYIYGSAEVVGLMCLKVFTGNDAQYKKLEKSASQLGAAYQKVNFLRDVAADAKELGRWYFPIASAKTFNEATKNSIIADIEKDFNAAKQGIDILPDSSRHAVALSYQYYGQLLEKIKRTPAAELMQKRVRINDLQKTSLFIQASLARKRRAS